MQQDRVSICDKDSELVETSVVASTDIPWKNWLVIVWADWKKIWDNIVVSLEKKYITYIDDYTTLNMTYIGKALPWTATSVASWSIFRMDETTWLVILQADSGNFTQIRNNRVSLVYS